MELVLDAETRDDHIKILGSGWACSSGFEVLGFSVSVDGADAYWSSDKEHIIELVSKATTLIAHNAQYDFGILMMWGCDLSSKTLIDTIILAKLDYNQQKSYSLDEMAKYYLGAGESKQVDELAAVIESHGLYKEKGKSKKCSDPKKFRSYAKSHMYEIYEVEPETLISYANQDVNLTRRLYQHLISKTEKAWLYRASCVLKMLLTSRYRGVPVDIAALKQVRRTIAAKETGFKVQLANQLDMLAEDLQLDSTKVLPTYFDKLGIKYPRTEKGSPSLKSKWMDAQEHPFCRLLSQYRKYQKVRRDFCDKLLENQELMRPDKRGFVYPEMYMFGAARTGRFSCKNPNCFDDKTEVLTYERGWQLIKDLKVGEAIAQYTPEENKISFKSHTNYIEQDANSIYHITNEQGNISLAVTDDHRLLLESRSGEFKVTNSANYFSDHKQLHGGMYSKHKNLCNIPNNILHLIFAIQADGNLAKSGVDFSFSRPRKIEYFKHNFSDLGYTQKNGKFRIIINYNLIPPIVWRYIDRDTKTFTNKLFELSRSDILDYLMFWDGDWTRKAEWKTNRPENIGPVQALLSLSNLRAISITRVVNGTTYYGVRVKSKNYSWTTNAKIERKSYNGKVYCLSVPSSYVVVRHKGVVQITGQCQQIPSRDGELGPLIRSCYRPFPNQKWYSLDISQQEFRIFAHYAHVMKWDSAMYVEYLANPKKDFHEMVSEICGIDRPTAKPINLGSLYGMGKRKMAIELHKDEDETEDLLEQYHSQLPAVKTGLKACSNILKDRGWIRTFFGRKSFISPPIFKDGSKITFEYKGLNQVIQGSAGDQMYEALTQLWNRGIVVLFTVHDELCLSTNNPNDVAVAEEILKTCLGKEFTVPMEVGIGAGANWSEAQYSK